MVDEHIPLVEPPAEPVASSTVATIPPPPVLDPIFSRPEKRKRPGVITFYGVSLIVIASWGILAFLDALILLLKPSFRSAYGTSMTDVLLWFKLASWTILVPVGFVEGIALLRLCSWARRILPICVLLPVLFFLLTITIAVAMAGARSIWLLIGVIGIQSSLYNYLVKLSKREDVVTAFGTE